MSEDYLAVRDAADLLNENNDCGVVATAIALNLPYGIVHESFCKAGRGHGQYTSLELISRVIDEYGMELQERSFPLCKTMVTVQQCIPDGVFLVLMSGGAHIACCRNTVLHDWSSDTRRQVTEIWEVLPKGVDDVRMHAVLSADGEEFVVHKCRNSSIFPERRLLQGKVYVPVTAMAVEILDRNMSTYDENASVLAMSLKLDHVMRMRVLERTALYKSGEDVDTSHVILHPENPLSKYQQVAAANSIDLDGYLWFMEQGTGKTAVAIADMCNLAADHDEPRPFLTVVVCPNAVRMNWARELEKFATVSSRSTIIRGQGASRLGKIVEAIKPGPQLSVVIIGYDSVRAVWDHLSMLPFDVGYLDESHWIKDSTTKRTEYVLKLRDRCKKKRAMTGTPIGNSPLDLFCQFEWLGKGESGFTCAKAFNNFYGVYEKNHGNDGRQSLVSIQNVPYMKKRLASHAIQFGLREVMPEMPDKVYNIHEVTMTDLQSSQYTQMANQLCLEMEGQEDILIQNMLTKLLRLAQITSGHINRSPVFSDDGELLEPATTIELDNPKLSTVIELTTDRPPTSKTIIWSCFRYSILKMMEAFGHEDTVYIYGDIPEKARQEAEDRFNNDPSVIRIVANPSCAGTGVNLLGYNYRDPEEEHLDTNCDWAIYYDQDWSFLKRDQSEFRANRRGSRVPCTLTDLVVPCTIDEEIRTRVVEKKQTSLQIRDVREILRKVKFTIDNPED